MKLSNGLSTLRRKLYGVHKNAIDRYRESANWFNGAKNWVPLSSLVALEWGNETLYGNFGGNAYVCHPKVL